MKSFPKILPLFFAGLIMSCSRGGSFQETAKGHSVLLKSGNTVSIVSINLMMSDDKHDSVEVDYVSLLSPSGQAPLQEESKSVFDLFKNLAESLNINKIEFNVYFKNGGNNILVAYYAKSGGEWSSTFADGHVSRTSY